MSLKEFLTLLKKSKKSVSFWYHTTAGTVFVIASIHQLCIGINTLYALIREMAVQEGVYGILG